MSNKNLSSAWRKVNQFSNTKEWCGYVTPCEALALIDEGAIPSIPSLYSKEYLLEKKAKGFCNPHWFYFYPTKQQLARWKGFE